MSGQDRDKWNDRYRAGAYAERPHPAALVERWVPDLFDRRLERSVAAAPRALDLACGAGRNAIWLAERGFVVDAVDVAEAGLELARRRAAERGVTVGWHCLDLDEGLPVELDGYDLILAMRFLDRQVFPQLPQRLRPGGWLLCEVHLKTDVAVIGPRGEAFRAAQGELITLFPGLDVVSCEEGLFEDPDGRMAALARLVGRRSD
jgi:tellurite methyltransferase